MMKSFRDNSGISRGCMTLVIIALIVIVALVGLFFYGKSKLAPFCDEYLEKIEKGEYESAYDGLHGLWKKEMALEDYIEFEKTVHDSLGKLNNKKVTGIHASTNTNGTTATVTYSAQFEKGDCTIIFTLIKSDKKWSIAGVNYNSDALLDLLICPHCHKIQESLGKYCSQCGEPMKPEDIPETTEEKDTPTATEQ